MAYLIKRYANRKLYDTRTKRYLTLDEVAVLVRAGEEVRVEEADSGDDLTAQVLAKIVAEGGRGGGPLVSQGTLVDLIRRPSEMMIDAVRSSVTAGQKTVEQMSGEVGKVLETVAGYAGKGRKQVEGVGDEVAKVIERRLRAILQEMNVATRDDLKAVERRVAALEAKVKQARTQAVVPKATATKPARKTAARRATETKSTKS